MKLMLSCTSGSRSSISGDILQQKAFKLSEYFENNDFKASNGWLNSFLSRHIIFSKRIIGELKPVDDKLFINFKELYTKRQNILQFNVHR